MIRSLVVGVVGVFLTAGFLQGAEGKRKLVLIAGKPSHPPLMHEFRAGCLLLEKCFEEAALEENLDPKGKRKKAAGVSGLTKSLWARGGSDK